MGAIWVWEDKEIKRPILIACVGYIMGIIWGLYFNINIVFIFVPIVFTYYLLNKYLKQKLWIKYNRYIKLVLKFSVIITLCGFAIISNIYINILDFQYANYNISKNGKFVGVIISEPMEKEYNYIYTLRLERINAKECKKTKVLLYVRKKDNYKVFEYGDLVELNRRVWKRRVSKEL